MRSKQPWPARETPGQEPASPCRLVPCRSWYRSCWFPPAPSSLTVSQTVRANCKLFGILCLRAARCHLAGISKQPFRPITSRTPYTSKDYRGDCRTILDHQAVMKVTYQAGNLRSNVSICKPPVASTSRAGQGRPGFQPFCEFCSRKAPTSWQSLSETGRFRSECRHLSPPVTERKLNLSISQRALLSGPKVELEIHLGSASVCLN